MMHVDSLAKLVALALVGIVFMDLQFVRAYRTESLVFIACLGAKDKEVRDVIDVDVVRPFFVLNPQ